MLLMYTTFGVSYCAVCSKWTEQHSSKLDAELLLIMLCSIGLPMLATWELEPNSFSKVVHYAAAGVSNSCGPIAFAMQQNFSWLSIAFVSVTYIGIIEWFVLHSILPARHEDLSIVHKLSKISIINETIVMALAYSCGVMYIYNL